MNAINSGIFIEHNLKENLPPEKLLKKIPSNKMITGFDAHSVKEALILKEGI